jgi:aspartokinase
MITVPQAVEKIVKRSRYLNEAMSKDLINASSLARYIQGEVEEITLKKVSTGSLIMAIKRLQKSISPNYKPITIFQEAPDMIVRSNLTLIYVKNSANLLSKLALIEKASKNFQKKTLFTYGRAETLILANKLSADSITKILASEQTTQTFPNVSSITIHIPQESVQNAGIFYFLIKSLAWEGINILDMLSTETELVLIFENKDVNEAFRILYSLFEEK